MLMLDSFHAFDRLAVNGGVHDDGVAAPAVDFDPAFYLVEAETSVRVQWKCLVGILVKLPARVLLDAGIVSGCESPRLARVAPEKTAAAAMMASTIRIKTMQPATTAKRCQNRSVCGVIGAVGPPAPKACRTSARVRTIKAHMPTGNPIRLHDTMEMMAAAMAQA